MMEHVKSLIWYTFLVVLFLVLYQLVRSYSVVVMEDSYRYMRPTMEGGMYFIDRTVSTADELEKDDVIAYEVIGEDQKVVRMFGRVLGLPGKTVSTREGRFLVEGADAKAAPDSITVLGTGMIVPRDMVFVVFDSRKVRRRDKTVWLRSRLVPSRNILGRLRRK